MVLVWCGSIALVQTSAQMRDHFQKAGQIQPLSFVGLEILAELRQAYHTSWPQD